MNLYYVVPRRSKEAAHEQLSLYDIKVSNHDLSIPVLLLSHIHGGIVEVLTHEGVIQLPMEYLTACE